MKLRQLKKQLRKQQISQAKRSKAQRRWLWGGLLVGCLALATPFYLKHRQGVPQRLYEAAVARESSGDVSGAQRLYQQLYEEYPAAQQAPEALLRSARIWQLDQRHDHQALLGYLQLEHDYPDSSLLQAAREEAARIYRHSLQDHSRAIEMYQRLIDLAPDQADRYLFEIADCYFRLDNYPQARIELETLQEQFPQSPLLAEVLYRKGGLYLLENRLGAARRDWQRLVQEFPASPYQVQARFNLARLLEEEERLQDALDAYRQLNDYPNQPLLQEKIDHLQKRIATKKKAI